MVINEQGSLTLGVGTDDGVETVKTAAVKEDAVYPEGDQANYDLSKIQDQLGVITEAQLAKLLNVKPQTLATWRVNGTGPAFSKPAGKTVLYFRDHVQEYLACKVVQTNRTLEGRE